VDDRDLGPARQPSTLPPPRERDGPPRSRCSVTLGVEWDARRRESNECVRAHAILAHVPELQGLTARTALQRDRALVRSQGARGSWLNVRMKKGTEPLFAVNMATSLSTRLPCTERASSCAAYACRLGVRYRHAARRTGAVPGGAEREPLGASAFSN
jgi:hypothetical protein